MEKKKKDRMKERNAIGKGTKFSAPRPDNAHLQRMVEKKLFCKSGNRLAVVSEILGALFWALIYLGSHKKRCNFSVFSGHTERKLAELIDGQNPFFQKKRSTDAFGSLVVGAFRNRRQRAISPLLLFLP
jgi:hypothetical protein